MQTTPNNLLESSQVVPASEAGEVLIRKRRSDAFDLDLGFKLGRGITIVFGASGAGKTTLLDCMAGLTTPDSGRVVVVGRTFFDSDRGINLEIKNRGVG